MTLTPEQIEIFAEYSLRHVYAQAGLSPSDEEIEESRKVALDIAFGTHPETRE